MTEQATRQPTQRLSSPRAEVADLMSSAPQAGPDPVGQRTWPWTGLPTALLAALTGWLALQSWRGMADEPGRFLAPLAVVAAVVAVLGWAVRRLRASALLAVLVQVVVLTVWLVHRSGAGWLPTPRALARFAGVLADGAGAGQTYTSPVSTEHLAFHFLLLVAGAAILVAVDLLCCGLHRATLAGLPLLLTITISTSVLLAPFDTRLFLLTSLGWLGLVALQENGRVGSWGRGNTTGNTSGNTSGVTSGVTSGIGAVVGLSARIALVCALVAAALTGTLSSEGRQFNGIGQGPGNGRIDVNNPILDLRRNLVQGKDIPLVVVNTQGAAPSYLRTTVLDQFTGEVWQPSRRTVANTALVQGGLPAPAGLDPSNSAATTVWRIHVASDFTSQWLPAPFPASTVGVDHDWRYGRNTSDMFAVGKTTAAGLTYDATAISPRITPAALRAAGPAPVAVQTKMTALPDNLPAVFRSTAARVTQGAADDFDRAVLLQRWFRADGGFSYSTEPAPGTGISTLARFITTDKVGYCEQFSTAMAVMARTLGIPARVAVGFLRPQKTVQGYVFSSHDLHAWPELYFEGVGWTRFEPTPQDRTSAAPAYTLVKLPTDPTALPTGPSASASSLVNPKKPRLPEQSTGGPGRGSSGTDLWVWLSLGSLLLLGALLLPRLARTSTTRRRWARAHTPELLADAAWSEVHDTAVDLELSWSDRGTVRSNGRLVERGTSPSLEARDALSHVVSFVELTRYARPRVLAESQRERLQRDVSTWRESVLAGADPRRSRRAQWWPRSVTGSAVQKVRSRLHRPRR